MPYCIKRSRRLRGCGLAGVIFLLLAWGSSAQAKSQVLMLRSAVRVFASPAQDALEITTLGPETKVRLHSPEDGFQKIEWINPDSKQKESGYVKSKGDSGKSSGRKLWLSGGMTFGYLTQPSKSIKVQSGEIYDISELNSQSTFPHFEAHYFLNSKRFVLAAVSLKASKFTGKSELRGVTQQAGKAEVNQSFYEGTLGYGWVLSRSFYALAFVETAKGYKVDVRINGSDPLDTGGTDLPVFVTMGSAIGCWLDLSDNYFVNSWMRVGGVINSQPVITSAEFAVSLGRRL